MLMFSEYCDKPVTIFLYHCHPLTDMNDFVYINAVYLVISVEFFVTWFPVVSFVSAEWCHCVGRCGGGECSKCTIMVKMILGEWISSLRDFMLFCQYFCAKYGTAVWIVMTIWIHALPLFLINLPFLTYYYEVSSVDVTTSNIVKQNSMTVCSLARKYQQFGETCWSHVHCRHQQSMKHLYK
jgi:hypothetical protein